MNPSPSVVRLATPQDASEIARLLMNLQNENSIFPPDPEKVSWLLGRVLYPERIPPGDVGTRGVIGVIGPVGALEALVFLIIGSFWYSNQYHLEELAVFVEPEYRKSSHAKALVKWMKGQVEITGLPLFTGIISNHRTEAKCRLYRRMLPKVGEFFMLNPKGSNLVLASS